ncbi:acyl-coenzyme A thioesterase 1-like [Esox lucius]|uniref:Uncharacterized protein n=1 Tax=Esox lucius TaxID=8010 RepID=A0A3P8YV76_ESOLU|nr:acyl-coenzyme A thioesterase 1-like [Esox lucius]XP_019898410.2 acyl-coenzyme A thioesterase 1-like [Esox lucius]
MSLSPIQIRLLPNPRCFFDEQVHVKVDGLSPHQKVELKSMVKDDKGVIFKASALYAADATGQVDLCRSPSLGGSYTGVEPMGLFWSMTAQTPHSKLVKRDVTDPMLVDIEVFDTDGQGPVLGTVTTERAFLGGGVRRTPVRGERIKGTLFTPPGPGPFPGVLDLPMMSRNISEVRACLLANKGFVVLAVALFGYEDQPKKVKHLDLEYFEEAVKFLRGRPEVHGAGIGVLAISKSGDVALSIASHLPGISATVAINGCNFSVHFPLHYKGTVISPSPLPVWDKITPTPCGPLNVREATSSDVNQASEIPIERSGSPFLFAASEDDGNWKSCLYAQRAVARLRRHGRENVEVVTYPGAGHYLEVPYMPHCPSAIHPAVGKVVAFGGEAKPHHEAQLDLWRRIQEFFGKHLEGRHNIAEKSRL